MKFAQINSFAYVALATIALVMPGLSLGQTTSSGLTAPQYKYTTPIAPGVAVPDTVETSTGTLNLHYGYPDEMTSGITGWPISASPAPTKARAASI